MKNLDMGNFPCAGMDNLIFKTVDGVMHHGRYDFNDNNARRWFDENNKEYTSVLVVEWEDCGAEMTGSVSK